MENKNILSLFDGISCARVALESAGWSVGNYYASEIDKHATLISSKNWPDIIQLGDVKIVGKGDSEVSRVSPNVDIVAHIIKQLK